jgi:hypothetical protein
MFNYLLKFIHSNGSAVWFTIATQHPNQDDVFSAARAIEKRTSYKFTNDVTLL